MKSLFTVDEFYTPEADELCQRSANVLTPIVQEYRAKGYTTRAIECVIREALMDIVLDIRLG